ncbi:NAD-dependent epimerase/dehydratase family protein [Bremerella sp. T1]|uniref:NAD-dependent epimerase/dehydratase family protein n=1 Tax=Bremerella sp. TYQ1 TaxID=3119568 RepID=UPI001CCD2AE0|nr:NAD(P)-dependent oxidoreductase [Bremerella volcania]UBM35407.1 NAD(P)-dependent oxidoreductase [Bremerella volcania]
MKILVIGGAGYVGSVLTTRLHEQGHELTVLDSLMFGSQSLDNLKGQERFELIEGDLRDQDLLDRTIPGHDAVCLLAAIVGEPACNRDEATAEEINLHGALKVLEASKKHGATRFVFTSTCSNYGISDPNAPATETSPLKPLSVYSRSKVEAEKAILASADENFVPTVLRLSTAFGISPRMRFDLLVSDFTLAAYREHKVVIYGGQFWRPFVHTQDIARAIEMVLNASPDVVSGEVFNIGGDGNNVQKQELGEMVKEEVPDTTIEYITAGTDPRSYRVEFSKAKSQLGFEPEWSVRDGVKEVYHCLQEDRWSDPKDARHFN